MMPKMDKMRLNRFLTIIAIMLGLSACLQDVKSGNQVADTKEAVQDTILVKQKLPRNASYDDNVYSKTFAYYWLVGTDTLDFVLHATEYLNDSTLHISVHHLEPILFKTALTKINSCFSLIENDFDLSKLSSFYFREPIYYLDLARELTLEYKQQFGQEPIPYENLNQFLLNSKPNIQLNKFLYPYKKEVLSYGIEKFHLIDQKDYGTYLPDVDLSQYPAFVLGGMGLYVQIEDR